MVDLNDDMVLDYFTALHGTTYNHFGSADIDLGETVLSKRNSERPIYLKDASWRVVVDDPVEGESSYKNTFMDKHGELIADLDNDGVLDILIKIGGGKGVNEGKFTGSKFNMLLFGEKAYDKEKNEEVTIFRGGRHVAEEAGLESPHQNRGRSSYLLGKSVK